MAKKFYNSNPIPKFTMIPPEKKIIVKHRNVELNSIYERDAITWNRNEDRSVVMFKDYCEAEVVGVSIVDNNEDGFTLTLHCLMDNPNYEEKMEEYNKAKADYETQLAEWNAENERLKDVRFIEKLEAAKKLLEENGMKVISKE
jgi:hypothetical protein